MTPVNIPTWQNLELYKAVLTFDNDMQYEAITTNTENNVLVSLQVNESQAITSGNPLGIMSPNSCNLVIYDVDNKLIQTNSLSPYYGYMRNGVKVELFISYDNGVNYEPYGIYYTEGWFTTKDNGSFQAADIQCTDKLSYIGNKDIPKLTAYAGVTATGLLTEIFTRIGLQPSEFSIDPSLSLDVVYSITKGDKLREVLNTIAQALIARITLSRAGVIQVIPAFPPKVIYGILDPEDIENATVEHNEMNVYTRVKLLYNKVGNQPSQQLIGINNLLIKPGLNTFNNLQFSQTILAIDGVYLDTIASNTSYLDKVNSPQYVANQSGIDIEVFSNLDTDMLVNLSVEGRTTGLTDSYVESEVKSTDIKVENVLTLESYFIQDEFTATTYVNKVSDYLYSMEQKITLVGTLNPVLEPGMYITLNSTDDNLDGDYLVVSFNLTVGESYNTALSLIKVRGLV